MKHLYLLRNLNRHVHVNGFSACIVCAETPEKAVLFHPDGMSQWNGERWSDGNSDWNVPDNIQCLYIGHADQELSIGVVVANRDS